MTPTTTVMYRAGWFRGRNRRKADTSYLLEICHPILNTCRFTRPYLFVRPSVTWVPVRKSYEEVAGLCDSLTKLLRNVKKRDPTGRQNHGGRLLP